MRVAWVTHREWDPTIGGAEAVDWDMVRLAPPEVKEITAVAPGGVAEDLEEFDHIIVTGLWGVSPRELNILQQFKSKLTFWAHDSQFSGHWFYTVPRNVIFASPPHIRHDLAAFPDFEGTVHVNPGWMDIGEIARASFSLERRQSALWAHRPVGHKGLDLAVDWAKEHNVPLDVMVGKPRWQVLEAMWTNKYFVLLSHIFDSGPRAVIEAQLAGCELILNDNVGWYDESPMQLAERVSRADKDFWEVVLS